MAGGGGRSILTGTFSSRTTATTDRSPPPSPFQEANEESSSSAAAPSSLVEKARLKMAEEVVANDANDVLDALVDEEESSRELRQSSPPPPKLTAASTSSSTVSLSTSTGGDPITTTSCENTEPRNVDDSGAGLPETGAVEVVVEEPRMFDESVEVEGCRLILDALSDDERRRLSDENMPLRHFRAEKGDVEKAIVKIKSTLAWRDEFQVSTIASCFNDDGDDDEDSPDLSASGFSRRDMADIIAKENETGKMYVRGYDRSGRAVMYMRPARENTRRPEDNMRHLVYNLERAVACTRRRSGGRLSKINIVIDYAGFRLGDAPPPRVSKHTLEILQDHYPERMHRAYVCDPPRMFRAFWTMIRPFLDPTTKEKIVFCHGEAGREVLARSFVLDDMESCAGGDAGRCVPFDSGEYLRSTPFDRTFAEG